MNQYRLVIVGVGNSVNNHLRAIRSLGDSATLIAAVDTSAERVKVFCEENQVPNAYTNVTDMLAAESPDLVCVVTPPDTHKQISIECMEAGSWVYCEKPLCSSLADFDALKAAEDQTGKFVSTVFQWRFGSAVKHLKQLMENEKLGKPLVAVCHTLWYRAQGYYDDVPWRGHYETEFGGPTMTLGIHLMDLLLYILGDWFDIRAVTGTLDRELEVEDTSMAIVRFENGAMGSIVNTALAPRQESYLRLDFQKATAEIKALYRASNESWTFTPASESDQPTQRLWEALDENFQGSHDQQLREILSCMDNNVRPLVSGEEARRIIEFTASLYKSAITGQTVVRGEITPEDDFYYSNSGEARVIRPS